MVVKARIGITAFYPAHRTIAMRLGLAISRISITRSGGDMVRRPPIFEKVDNVSPNPSHVAFWQIVSWSERAKYNRDAVADEMIK
jgi:hypothetical protein